MAIDLNGLPTVQSTNFGHAARIQKSSKELSSGKKEAAPSDQALADRLDAVSRGLAQALRNVEQATGYFQTAQGGIQTTSDSLARIKELTIQYKQAGTDEKAIIQDEIDAQLAEIDKTASLEYDGQKLLSSDKSTEIQVGAAAGETVTLKSGTNLTVSGLGLSGFDASSSNSLDQLESAAGKVHQAAGSFATVEKRLETISRSVATRVEATAASRSRIQDTDFAQALAERTRNQILERQEVAVRAQGNLQADGFLSLLQSASKKRF